MIQRRQDGSVNFFTTWQHYKVGTGGGAGLGRGRGPAPDFLTFLPGGLRAA